MLLKLDKSKNIVAVLLITIIVLVGYYQLFLGADFFVERDPFAAFQWAHGNSIGNGWRPEKGFGISFFLGDPGVFHPWSLLVIWEWIIGNGVLAYASSIVLLLILTAFAQYCFLRKIAPGIKWASLFLAPLIVFGPLQHEFYFQRHWITLATGTPLLLMLLYNFMNKPRSSYYFLAALLFWFVLFFGSLVSFVQLMIVGLVFIFLYYLYYKTPLKQVALRFLALYSFAIASTILLGAWVFYSIFIELSLIDYVREPHYLSRGLFNILPAIDYFVGLFHSGWLPGDAKLVGFNLVNTFSWSNCCAIFPLIFVFYILRGAKSFWEFVLKWLLVIFLTNEFLMRSVPAYYNLLNIIFRGYPLIKFQAAYHVFQIGLIAIFLKMYSDSDKMFLRRKTRIVQRTISAFLVMVYLVLISICLIKYVSPEFLPNMLSGIVLKYAGDTGSFSSEVLALVAEFNVKRIQVSMNLWAFLFYAICVAMAVPFLRDSWLKAAMRISSSWLAFVLLLGAIFMSWSIYPLNDKEVMWNSEKMKAVSVSIKPYDRMYYVAGGSKKVRDRGGFEKYIDNEDAARFYVGEEFVPGLNLSAGKSFNQSDVADYTIRIYGDAWKNNRMSLRSLRHAPLVSSELLDMGAVKYYYSSRELEDYPSNLIPHYVGGPLYIYENKNAWQYYYLARRVRKIDGLDDLKGLQRGGAYLFPGDYYSGHLYDGNLHIELKDMSYGRYAFEFRGSSDALLVVADAWHPFWRARAYGEDLEVVKTNGIFKGIKLKPGKYQIELYFDTAPYRVGIYISIVSWILFLFAWIVCSRRERMNNLRSVV